MDGIDLSANLVTDLGKAGELWLFFAGTRLLKYGRAQSPLARRAVTRG